MHKVDTDGNVANLFSDGTPGVAVATQVDAAILNAIQEELINILTVAGVAPVKGTWTQVLASLRTLFVDRANAQTNIAGNKGWLGVHTFAGGVECTADVDLDSTVELGGDVSFDGAGRMVSDIPMGGAYPAKTDAVQNKLTPAHIPKGSAVITLNNTSTPAFEGFNIDYVDQTGSIVTVYWKQDFLDANYNCQITHGNDYLYSADGMAKAAGSVQFTITKRSDGSFPGLAGSNGFKFDVFAIGKQ